MSKIAIIGDVHLSDVQVTTRLDNYNEAILAKLEFVKQACNDRGMDAVFFLGDLFHRKAAQQTTHQTISRLIDIFNGFKCNVYTIIGNHDYNHSMEALDKQPIYVLKTSGAIQIIGDNMPKAKCVVATGKARSIEVYGLSHLDENDEKLDNYNRIDNSINRNNFNILLTHQWIFEDGFQFFGHYLNYENLKDLHFDIIANGHYHPAGEEKQVYGKLFLRPGAICRVSSSKEDLALKPRFVILDIDVDSPEKKYSFEYVQIPFEPADKVFDMNAVKHAKISKEEISKFTKSLQAAEIEEVDTNSVESVVNLLATIQSDQEVLDTCKKYLDEAKEALQ